MHILIQIYILKKQSRKIFSPQNFKICTLIKPVTKERKSYKYFHYWPQPAEMMLSKPSSTKKGRYTCQRLDNVDVQLYAKVSQNIPRGSRVASILQYLTTI